MELLGFMILDNQRAKAEEMKDQIRFYNEHLSRKLLMKLQKATEKAQIDEVIEELKSFEQNIMPNIGNEPKKETKDYQWDFEKKKNSGDFNEDGSIKEFQ